MTQAPLPPNVIHAAMSRSEGRNKAESWNRPHGNCRLEGPGHTARGHGVHIRPEGAIAIIIETHGRRNTCARASTLAEHSGEAARENGASCGDLQPRPQPAKHQVYRCGRCQKRERGPTAGLELPSSHARRTIPDFGNPPPGNCRQSTAGPLRKTAQVRGHICCGVGASDCTTETPSELGCRRPFRSRPAVAHPPTARSPLSPH